MLCYAQTTATHSHSETDAGQTGQRVSQQVGPLRGSCNQLSHTPTLKPSQIAPIQNFEITTSGGDKYYPEESFLKK